ncbi:MAG: TRAP transporter small permease [Chloroflexota bacterium]
MLIVFYMTADVAGRYIAHRPLPASFEIPMVLIVFIVYFSLPYVQSRGVHLRLDFLWRRFNPRGQAIISILSLLTGLFLFSVITWQSWNWAVEAWQINERMEGAVGIPYFPARLGLTIGAFLFCIQYIIDLIRHVGKLLRIGQIGQQQ